MGQITHKMSYSKVYRTWVAMLSRCRNPNDNNYVNYGGRGISVCERWEKFENFYADMGDLPFYEAQIDRIDNEMGYFPGNCRWVSCKENSRNRRSSKRLSTHLGKEVQQDLIENIGWTKHQFRWYLKRYGISWILDGYKNNTLPDRVNQTIDRQDIVGKEFGKWVVLKFESYTKKTGHLYLCRCECGREKLIPRNNLMRGKTSRCGKCSSAYHWSKRRQHRFCVQVDY